MSTNDKFMKSFKTRQKDFYVEISSKSSYRSYCQVSKSRVIMLTALVIGLCIFFYHIGLFTFMIGQDISEIEQKADLGTQQTPDNSLPEVNLNANELNHSYVHLVRDICSKRPPFLLILIKTRVSSFKQRDAIRRTWGALDEQGHVKRVFLVGKTSYAEDPTGNMTRLIQEESSRYGDIVQFDFVDAYKKNTVKILLGFKWIIDYCPQSRYQLLIDDDTFLNPKLVISFLKKNVTQEMENVLYAGRVAHVMPQRFTILKWYLTLEEYPYQKFPPFVTANFMLLSQSSLRSLYKASHQFKLFFQDDAYLGVLAYMCRIKPVLLPNVIGYMPVLIPHKMYGTEIMGFHGLLGVSSDDMLDIWKSVGDSIAFREEFFSMS